MLYQVEQFFVNSKKKGENDMELSWLIYSGASISLSPPNWVNFWTRHYFFVVSKINLKKIGKKLELMIVFYILTKQGKHMITYDDDG